MEDEYIITERMDDPKIQIELEKIEQTVILNTGVRYLKKCRVQLHRISNWHISPKQLEYKRAILSLITKKLNEWWNKK